MWMCLCGGRIIVDFGGELFDRLSAMSGTRFYFYFLWDFD